MDGYKKIQGNANKSAIRNISVYLMATLNPAENIDELDDLKLNMLEKIILSHSQIHEIIFIWIIWFHVFVLL